MLKIFLALITACYGLPAGGQDMLPTPKPSEKLLPVISYNKTKTGPIATLPASPTPPRIEELFFEKGIQMNHRLIPISSKLSHGSFGSVFISKNGPPEAIKVYPPDRIGQEHFQIEARVLRKLLRLREHSFDAGYYAIRMPLFRGTTFYNLFSTNKIRNETVVDVIIRKALRELDQLHSIGIIHRDLHTNNIIVDLERDYVKSVKLIDFGRAVDFNCLRDFDCSQDVDNLLEKESQAFFWRMQSWRRALKFQLNGTLTDGMMTLIEKVVAFEYKNNKS